MISIRAITLAPDLFLITLFETQGTVWLWQIIAFVELSVSSKKDVRQFLFVEVRLKDTETTKSKHKQQINN